MAGLYARYKLSTAVWRILSIIGRYEPIFAGAAGQLSTMEPDKVTRAVDRLAEMKLVVRNADNADRRRVILCLSSRGRTVYEDIERASRELDTEWRSALTADEAKVFARLIDKLDAQARKLFTAADAQKLGGKRRKSRSNPLPG